MTISAMLDVPPPEADHAVRPAAGDSRANALATLGFAALTLGSLAIPWADYQDGSAGSLSWSGFDIMGDPKPVSDSIGSVVTCLHVLQWLSIGLIVLSALRLIVPASRLAWLSLLAATVLAVCAALAAFQLHSKLQGIDAVAPSMRAGPVVTALAAVLCLIAAGRGPAARRAGPRTQPGKQPGTRP
ncbi:hypothetical protein [Catenulispora acidiphila]|uniref:hypothetical protein n=1 Tax=Catenulispora acidiphila TaxID=304895 RepID=UPI0002F965DA|nr:hypothetical protein [Catenulispora acidiphila]